MPYWPVRWPSAQCATFRIISHATLILRGLRDVSDVRYEFQLALANRAVGGVETIFIMTGDQYALTNSSLIRQVVWLGGDARKLRGLVPALVVRKLAEKRQVGHSVSADWK